MEIKYQTAPSQKWNLPSVHHSRHMTLFLVPLHASRCQQLATEMQKNLLEHKIYIGLN